MCRRLHVSLVFNCVFYLGMMCDYKQRTCITDLFKPTNGVKSSPQFTNKFDMNITELVNMLSKHSLISFFLFM